MSSKSITINPSLFRIGGHAKTKKDRTPNSTPVISPNILKNKLLSRIKEHKNRETESLETNRRKPATNDEQKPRLVDESLIDFNNEFNSSINYLQTLSKQKRVEDEKNRYENKKQELHRKTVKNHNPEHPFVNVELHEDLIEQHLEQQKNNVVVNHRVSNDHIVSSDHIVSNNNHISVNHASTMKIKPNSSIPYGNLKNGTKPTYREWSKTQKNGHVNTPVDNERERKLNALKEKIRQQKIIEQQKQLSRIQVVEQVAIPEPRPAEVEEKENEPTTRLVKKTIRRQYTLGKSKTKNTVSILLKNNTTRKQVIDAHKDLKRKPINQVKSLLREQNLIKKGTNSPNYLLREIYESSMLAGKITNNNKDMLLHNFMEEPDN